MSLTTYPEGAIGQGAVGSRFTALPADLNAVFRPVQPAVVREAGVSIIEEASAPMNMERQNGVRRWVWPSLMLFAGIVIALVAVSRATYSDDAQKAQAATPNPAAEAEIRDLLKAVTQAYNQADARKLADQFTDDATLVDQEGNEVQGREAIRRHYAEAFGDGPTCKISGKLGAVHFLSPDVASVTGRFQLQDDDGTPLSLGRYGLIAVRKGGQWRLAELHDDATASRETSEPEAPLRALEWMLGDWVDEGEDGKIASNVRWEEGQKFLVRRYSSQTKGEPKRSGTQWIGWDPQAQQIRSWVFDSDGDFGHGEWTRAGDAWVVKASGVTGDGLTTSATQIFEPVNKDAVKMRSTDRVVGTELLPDIEEVVMVRKPPSPGPDRPASRTEQTPPAGASAPKSDRR
jgi:uncharacterized protein (TIGR02246 family)